MHSATRFAVLALLLGTPAFAQTRGIIPANMDPAVKPGNDFFRYSNGAWIAGAEIPSDKSRIDVFSTLRDISDKRTVDIIQQAAATTKIAALYKSFMDEPAIEAKGLTPLRSRLDAITAISNKRQLSLALGQSLRADVDPLNTGAMFTSNIFGLWVAPDFADPEHYTPYLLQGGLTMPNRDYYLADSPAMRDTRAKYQAHIAAMLKLARVTDTDIRATRIFELERAIAEKQESLAESEDIHKANNVWKAADFPTKAPGLDWAEFFRGASLTAAKSFIVWQPATFTGESALVAATPLEAWKDWLTFHLIEANAGALPAAFADERFNFFGKVLSGTTAQRPRWQRGVVLVNSTLGDDVGRIYATKYFFAAAKADIQAMVANMIESFRKRIEALTWMDPATKAEAQAKLTTLYVGIGYPETYRDYSSLQIKPDDLIGNTHRADLYDLHRAVSRIGHQVDRKEWCTTPQTVNAYNLPVQNALNFPAAMLQPPYFDTSAPAATNYGAIGSLIGHEISHTFDNEGSAFDSKGRVRNWWTKADLEHFETSTAKLAAQHDAYKAFPDLSLNGKQTLGEDIADVAGLAAAFDGYRTAVGKAGGPPPAQDGFTPDQQFFIAFGQFWGAKTRDAALRQQIATDGHSPGEFRSQTVRNLDAWYAAFDIKPGDKLYLAPEDRVPVW